MALKGLFDTAYSFGQDLSKGVQDYGRGLSKVEQEFQSGDRNVGEYILGTGYYGVAKPIEELFSYFIPDPIEEAIGSAAQYGMEATGLDDALQSLDPDTRRAAEEAFGLFGILSPAGAVKGQLGSRAVAKGAPDTRTARERARAGMVSSNFDVIIDNFYDPNTKTYPGLRGATSFDKLGRKLMGLGEWGAKGIARTAKLAFDPVARARFMETGVTPVATDAYKKFAKLEERMNAMPDGDAKKELQKEFNTALETITSQMQQMGNIGEQAGTVPLKRNVPREFVERAAMEGTPIYKSKAELGDNWFDASAGTKGNVGPLNPEVSQFVGDYIEEAWRRSGLDMDRAKILVKAPSGRLTGDHWASMAFNAQVNAIERAFRETTGRKRYVGGEIVRKQSGPDTWRTGDLEPDVAEKRVLGGTTETTTAPPGGFYDVEINGDNVELVPDIDGLQKALEETRVTRDADGKLSGDEKLVKTFGKDAPKNFDIVGQDNKGVWIRFSHPARAKVEGGMNILMRVEPDGTLTSIASDLHDFGDKLPGINKLLDDALPNQVLAVTPPMQSNVFSLSSLRSNKKDNVPLKEEYGEFVEEKLIDKPKPQLDETQGKEELRVLGDLQPSKAEIARQTVPVAQNVAFTANVLDPDEDFQIDPDLIGP